MVSYLQLEEDMEISVDLLPTENRVEVGMLKSEAEFELVEESFSVAGVPHLCERVKGEGV